jgi:hypothetical protein
LHRFYTNFAMVQPAARLSTSSRTSEKQHRNARLFPSITFLRVSFGTPPQMKEFWRLWDLLPAVWRKM